MGNILAQASISVREGMQPATLDLETVKQWMQPSDDISAVQRFTAHRGENQIQQVRPPNVQERPEVSRERSRLGRVLAPIRARPEPAVATSRSDRMAKSIARAMMPAPRALLRSAAADSCVEARFAPTSRQEHEHSPPCSQE